ncbi:MAG: glycosyltransferase family 39 protein [Patescibacteria group bacterium]|nr:glycosyltransferase family 39 protein [Patescibacteria group bacterium]
MQPIFADEAIYIRWAQVMKAEPSLRFLPLTDGKTPLFMWILMGVLKFVHDPLMAGRLLSIISGYFTLLGVFAIGWRFFNFRVGLYSALLVTVVPFMVFLDRMALVDSMTAAFSVWALFSALLLIKEERIDLAMILGYFYGGGLLTKTPALFSILMLPTTLITFDWKSKISQHKLLRLLCLWVIALVIAFGIYNLLRLGSGFANLSSRNQDYIFSPLQTLVHPFDPFIPHLQDTIIWFIDLLSWPILLLLVGGIVGIIYHKNKTGWAIFLWGLLPMLILLAFLKTFTTRYILSSIPPLLIIAALALDQLGRWLETRIKLSMHMILLLLLLWPIYLSYLIVTQPLVAILPRSERSGYFEDWTAGWGLREIAQYLTQQSQQGLVVVATEGIFGTLPDGLQIYFDKNTQVVFKPGNASASAQLRQTASEHSTFLVVNSNRFSGNQEGLQLIQSYPKAKAPDGHQDSMLLFKVLPADLSGTN